MSDRPAAPLSFPDHEGQAQYLARMAARAAGVDATFVVLPWKRCVESARSGAVDAVLGAQAYQAFKDFLRFPLKNGLPDRTQSVGVDTWVLVAQQDSRLRWDGKALQGQTLPVSYPSGVNVVRQALDDLKIRHVDSAKTAMQLLQMLSVGRFQAVVIHESDAQAYLAQKEFESLRILAPVFLASDAYLVFGNEYAQAHRAAVAAIWDAIRRIRTGSEWGELAPSLAR